MNRKRLQQVVLGSAGAVVLAGGALLAAAEYQAGNQFAPTESDRALNINQVVFPEQEKPTQGADQDSKDNSELWEKDQNADDTEHPRENSTADYLFESSQAVSGDGPQNATLNGTTTAGSSEGGADIIYDITGDASRADVVLDSGAGAEIPGGETEADSNADKNDNGNANSGNNGSTDAGTTVTPAPNPAPDPEPDPDNPGGSTADRVQDPEIVKPDPGPGNLTYDESIKDQLSDIGYSFIFTGWSSTQSFYFGQKLTARDIYSSMDAYIFTSNWDIYYFTDADYGKYVKVDAVSFDGGETWITDFPVTIPDGLEYGDFKVQASYRLSTKDEWKQADPETVDVKSGRVLVLNEPLSSDATQVSSDMILNDSGDQYADPGTLLPLLKYQAGLLEAQGYLTEDGHLTGLVAGWSEDGKTQPWFYEITAGRHLLEPLPILPLDTQLYQAELLKRWTTPDLIVYEPEETSPNEAKYVSLQTLTHYKGSTTYDEDYNDYIETLQVPEGFQAVKMLYQPALAVGTLELPDSVFYVDTSGVNFSSLLYNLGMSVKDAYVVSENNPRYTSKDGLLYNKDETTIEGVPTNRTELEIPFGVAQVNLPYGNHLQTVTLDTFMAEFLPEMDYTKLPGTCRIQVEETMLDDYLRAAADELGATTLHVSSIEDPAHSYVVKGDVALNDDGVLHLVLTNAKRWTALPDYVHGLGKSSLQESGIVTLMLPQDGSAFTFEQNCFEGADDLKLIGCYSIQQYDAAVAAVAASGKDIEVVQMYEDEVEGDWSYLEAEDGILLLNAPKNLVEFDGYIPLENGEKLAVTAIADGVFEDSENLTWVTLPADTTAIGYQAFKGCTSLQGVLIGKAESITIAPQAFDGCTSLRFLASNAETNVVEDSNLTVWDDEYKLTYMFVLEDANAYGGNWAYFGDAGIDAYSIVDCGGTKVLYAGTDGEQWLAIRGGSIIKDTLNLPATTTQIYSAAFKDARAANGHFTVNWQELENSLYIISYAAFKNSDIGTDIVMPEDMIVGEAAFYNCNYITSFAQPGWDLTLYRNALTYCSNLQSVTYGSLSLSTSLNSNEFYGCDSLQEITFQGRQPPQLVLDDGGYKFSFNGQWYTDEEEAEHLHITVPEDCEEDYIEAWRTAMLGYPDSVYSTGYQALWNDVRADLIKQLGVVPSDDAIRAKVDARLLDSENRIRGLFGMEKVDAIQHRYSYTVDENGDITLTVARGIEYTELTSAELELPEGKGLSYIGSQAFGGSPDLRVVFLPEELKGIWHNAFSGVKFDESDTSDGLMIIRSGDSIPQLLIDKEGIPFKFCEDDSRVEVVDLSASSIDADAYVQAWTLPMTGYSTLEKLRAAVTRSLTNGGVAPSDEAVEIEMEKRLRVGENRVRALLPGCEQLTEDEPITYKGMDQEVAELSLDELFATPETAALPAETDDTDTTGDTTETPAGEVPEDSEPDADTEDTTTADEPADAPPDDIATPETAQAG